VYVYTYNTHTYIYIYIPRYDVLAFYTCIYLNISIYCVYIDSTCKPFHSEPFVMKNTRNLWLRNSFEYTKCVCVCIPILYCMDVLHYKYKTGQVSQRRNIPRNAPEKNITGEDWQRVYMPIIGIEGEERNNWSICTKFHPHCNQNIQKPNKTTVYMV